MTKSYKRDLTQYKKFIDENFPNSVFKSSTKLGDVFKQVNSSFVFADILTEFNFVEERDSYFILLIEYKRFCARFLSTITLNDKYLLDNLFRVLIERIYRILVGIHYPVRQEARLRKSGRKEMSDDLDGKLLTVHKNKLDDLYRTFSNEIHLTDKNSSNQYDIVRLFRTAEDLDVYVLNNLNYINEIFINEIFICLCRKSPHLVTTGVKAKINNNIPETEANKIIIGIE